MELIVLGSSASFPAAGDACSGYLVRQNSTQILLDCGSGVLGRLVSETRLSDLSAIVITHFHPDHYLDLVPMRYGLRYSTEAVARPRLLLPPGGKAFLEGVGAALRNSPGMFNASFQVEEYDPGQPLQIGDLRLRFQRTTHDEPTWAVAVEGNGLLVYTSDTRECPELEQFAMGSDVLLCEATYPGDEADLPSDNHLTSAQAGELAQRAGARQLVLTHFWPGFERSRFQKEARKTFNGPVALAHPEFCMSVSGQAGMERDVLVAAASWRDL